MSRDATGARRCVVLADASDRPGPLLAALHQQHIDTHVAQRPVDVMVELAQRATHVVILHGPRDESSSVRLVTAVRRYYPKLVCAVFGFDDAGRRCLISLGHSDDIAATLRAAWRITHPPHPPQPPEPPESTTTHDAIEDMDDSAPTSGDWETWMPDPDAAHADKPVTPSALLSPEEIEVLIGPRPTEY